MKRPGYEKVLGVKLTKNQVIHHKDHNPKNNEKSNLQVLTIEEHKILHAKGKNAFYKFRKKQEIEKAKKDLVVARLKTVSDNLQISVG